MRGAREPARVWRRTRQVDKPKLVDQPRALRALARAGPACVCAQSEPHRAAQQSVAALYPAQRQRWWWPCQRPVLAGALRGPVARALEGATPPSSRPSPSQPPRHPRRPARATDALISPTHIDTRTLIHAQDLSSQRRRSRRPGARVVAYARGQPPPSPPAPPRQDAVAATFVRQPSDRSFICPTESGHVPVHVAVAK
jgi:hypothetical protein